MLNERLGKRPGGLGFPGSGRGNLHLKAKQTVFVVVRALQGLFILCLAYLLVLIGVVLWTFEVKLHRWPTFVYAAPFSLQVGDDFADVRFMERLVRLGYIRGPSLVPEPGQWSQSGSSLSLFLKHSPLVSEGISTGPVNISLDWNRVGSIELMRSREKVNRIVLEPESAQHYTGSRLRPRVVSANAARKDPSVAGRCDCFYRGHALLFPSGHRYVFYHTGSQDQPEGRPLCSGRSTIPQQLIRMTILTPEKTMGRKVNEISLALVADAIYSKKTILQAYLNRVYFGQWGPFPIQGVAEAARHLFGKDVSELDAAECSLMAATIRAPGVINPHRHLERTLTRRNMVLGLLFKAGKISREQDRRGYKQSGHDEKAWRAARQGCVVFGPG